MISAFLKSLLVYLHYLLHFYSCRCLVWHFFFLYRLTEKVQLQWKYFGTIQSFKVTEGFFDVRLYEVLIPSQCITCSTVDDCFLSFKLLSYSVKIQSPCTTNEVINQSCVKLTSCHNSWKWRTCLFLFAISLYYDKGHTILNTIWIGDLGCVT